MVMGRWMAQQGRQVEDGIDVVLQHNGGDLLAVRHVADFIRTALFQDARGLGTGNIAGHNMLVAVNAAQFHRQFGTDLTGSSDNQDIFHCRVIYEY